MSIEIRRSGFDRRTACPNDFTDSNGASCFQMSFYAGLPGPENLRCFLRDTGLERRTALEDALRGGFGDRSTHLLDGLNDLEAFKFRMPEKE